MDAFFQWMKDNLFLTIILFFLFILLINLLLKWLVNLVRLPKYRAFRNYKKLKAGMNYKQVEQILAGSRLKKVTNTLWIVKAKWRVKMNTDEIYELKIIFDNSGKLVDLKLNTTVKSWRWVQR